VLIVRLESLPLVSGVHQKHFPHLEKLATLSFHSFPKDFQLELPNLFYLKLICGSLVTSNILTEILCNQSLPERGRALPCLGLRNVECLDWSAFQGVKLENLNLFKVEMSEYS